MVTGELKKPGITKAPKDGMGEAVEGGRGLKKTGGLRKLGGERNL